MRRLGEKLNISNAALSALLLLLILGVVPFFIVFGVNLNSIAVFFIGLTLGGNMLLALSAGKSGIKTVFWFILFVLFLSFVSVNNLL